MTTADQFFDLEAGGVIEYRWRWDVVSPGGTAVLGQVTPARAPTIVNDSTAQVPRRVSGFTLYKTDATDLNVVDDRISPVLVLPDRSEWRAGVFVVSTEARPLSSVPTLECELHDETAFLDVGSDGPVAMFIGSLPTETIAEVLADAGLSEFDVTPDYTTPTPDAVGWPSDTPRRRIVDELADLVGYWHPYQTNAGPVRCHGIDDTEVPSLIYSTGRQSRAVRNSIVDETSYIGAPNRYEVVSNGAIGSPIVGIYDIPEDFEHSFANTRRRIVDRVEMQGLASTAAAERAARQRASADLAQRKQLRFQSLVDLRHDTHSVLDFDSTLYRETRWEIDTATGIMSHACQGLVTL